MGTATGEERDKMETRLREGEARQVVEVADDTQEEKKIEKAKKKDDGGLGNYFVSDEIYGYREMDSLTGAF